MLNTNKLHLGGILILSFMFLMFSCEEKKKAKNIKSTSSKIDFLLPKSGESFQWGDTIYFDIELNKKEERVAEKITLFINNEVVAEQSGGTLNFDYLSASGTGGQVKVKTVIKFNDGSISRKRLGLKILAKEKPLQLKYELVNVYPHDKDAYTQGLVYENGFLYEGTGNYGTSHLRKVEIETGEFIKDIALDDIYFGEGIAILNDTIYQLTYKNKTGFYYNMDFDKLGEFSYTTEGWGLDQNGEYLIMSDGSAYIYYLNPRTFEKVKSIQVFDHKGPVFQLNEMANVDGVIYANVYTTDKIIKIDAQSGMVLAEINTKGILKKEYLTEQVDYLNGIAYNPDRNTFFITGKWWPKLFEVRFVE
jgi:glutamine cyclotransferase